MFVDFDGFRSVGVILITKQVEQKETKPRYQDQARVVWRSKASVIQVPKAKRKVGNADGII